MRAVRVDFAQPPRWPVRAVWSVGVLMAVAACWVGWGDLRRWQVLVAQQAVTEALQAQADTARAARAAQAASAAELPSFAVDARRWLALAKLDSTGVLRTVESARVAGAKLIALDVNADARRAELEVEVTSAEVATAYLQALNAGTDQPAWTLVRLQTQGAVESALITGQLR